MSRAPAQSGMHRHKWPVITAFPRPLHTVCSLVSSHTWSHSLHAAVCSVDHVSAKVRKATETIDFYGHSVQNFDLNIQNQSSVWTPDQGGREGCKHKESLIFYEGFRHRCNTVTHSRHAGEGGAGLNINYCRLFITGEKKSM